MGRSIGTVGQNNSVGRGGSVRLLVATAVVATVSFCGLATAAATAAPFAVRLDSFLGALRAKGLLGDDASAGIAKSFASLAVRQPGALDELMKMGAIPEFVDVPVLVDELVPVPLRSSASRPVSELLGEVEVTESNVRDVFRRIYLPTKSDGAQYDMFVREAYAAYVASGRFKNQDGSLNRSAVDEYVLGERVAYSLFESGFDRMSADGSLGPFAAAVNSFARYSASSGIRMRPAQFRNGLAKLTLCFEARKDSNPTAYAESCGTAMRWLGDHDGKPVSISVTELGHEKAQVRIFSPWDANYATGVFGKAFSEFQQRANDRMWVSYFKRYSEWGDAVAAQIGADEMGLVASLTRASGSTVRALNAMLASSSPEARAASKAEAKAMLEQARSIRTRLGSGAGPETKARQEFRQAMQAFDMAEERAREAGIE